MFVGSRSASSCAIQLGRWTVTLTDGCEFEAESSLRPLAAVELAVLVKLLGVDFPGRDALREQAATVMCRQVDQEGSLELEPNYQAPPATVVGRIPVEAETEDADGVLIHVYLHVIDGYMNELEILREDSGKPQRPINTEGLRVY